MSRFDGLCHQAWVRGRRRYGGESLRGDARAEFLEEMLDGANYADQAARDDRRWWTTSAYWLLRLACWAQNEAMRRLMAGQVRRNCRSGVARGGQNETPTAP